jgi:hypothetical protein
LILAAFHVRSERSKEHVMILKDTLRYELPPGGITLLGYIVRRMHKTTWLVPVPRLIEKGDSASALAHVGMYALAASTSFGPAFYQPAFDSQGAEISGADPATGARVTATLQAVSPHYVISYSALMQDGSAFEGSEEITGTTVGLRGLGMPAPSVFRFQSGTYSARLTGTITSELAIALWRRTRIRAYGQLRLTDSEGNSGWARVERNGEAGIEVNGTEMLVEDEYPVMEI